jgi:hypothetical protein
VADPDLSLLLDQFDAAISNLSLSNHSGAETR